MINHIRWSLLAGSVMVQGLLAIFDTPYTNSAAVSFSQHQPCGTQSVSSYTSPQAWGAPVYNPLAATVQANEWSCAANQEVHTTAQAESNDHRFFKTIRALQLQGDYRALQKMKRMLIRRQQSWRDAFAFRWAAYQERKRQLRQLKKLMADPTTQLLCKLKDTDIATAIQLVQSLQQESATHKAIGADQVDHGLSVEEKIRAAM